MEQKEYFQRKHEEIQEDLTQYETVRVYYPIKENFSWWLRSDLKYPRFIDLSNAEQNE